MNSVTLGASVIWLFVLIYAVLGSIDFGSSFWRWQFNRSGDWRAEGIASTYVSPTWELINSFLVLIPVTLVGLFPGAVFVYGSVLLIPSLLLLVLIALRGAYLQFAYASPKKRSRTVRVAGITGLLLPGVFMSVLALSQGGYVKALPGGSGIPASSTGGAGTAAQTPHGVFSLDVIHFFTSPVVYLFIAFGISLSLYLSALFLARYAYLGGDLAAYESFRRKAIWMGPISLFTGVLSLVAPTPESAYMWHRLLGLWPIALFSAAAFTAGYLSLWGGQRRLSQGNPRDPHMDASKHRDNRRKGTGRPQWALVFTLLQVIAAHWMYGAAHAGYWLYPYADFTGTASNPTMFHATLVVLGLGTLVLIPGFLWFRRLFINNAEYAAKHSRFRETH
ncbi:cytochrome d ubiquinol oxidase subunit II [Alicyclobacillus tolerans]|uniref:cytochrome d ubiquinol oxidase subunit II n=1 Tax=Alicyclobacillus tolerans TaxID=90970 RepID=UPI001F015D97|nr:cytochrome d ubiquinol oxidase subunit II [Alicyclobacillus tolerans]MCF8566103.1 cytochrome d ubiquinol oxidase subunit II [Alicyclobacillus tolerans]